MKLKLNARFVPAALATLVLGSTALPSAAETVALATSPNPSVVLSGQSGGTVSTPDCGKIAATPNHVLNVTQRINSMNIKVQSSGGQPTLLIDGPDGRFCAVTAGGQAPTIPGLWMPGQYRIYVGDLSGSSNGYTISISQ
ncbi:hypothetical protein [Oscillatoria sp. FACHB-1406]|uniref:hypothetical protein n=1 Tax=Oscillatoria sp. FACHB-1406 TaxID=2692846 RepID=UPI00168785E4|nr:hypothetical protein [Oscillatoria sp. FACHB-1406]MBD2579068.1 hypothetical protein [Oscillatoria sp. FACHB-1406]